MSCSWLIVLICETEVATLIYWVQQYLVWSAEFFTSFEYFIDHLKCWIYYRLFEVLNILSVVWSVEYIGLKLGNLYCSVIPCLYTCDIFSEQTWAKCCLFHGWTRIAIDELAFSSFLFKLYLYHDIIIPCFFDFFCLFLNLIGLLIVAENFRNIRFWDQAMGCWKRGKSACTSIDFAICAFGFQT